METKFTPGEWRVDGDDIVCPDVPCIQICAGEIGPDFYHVADVASQYDEDKNEFVITERDRANAHLIAAAPEMYEALNDVLQTIKIHFVPYEIETIEKVLKKARGEGC